MHIHCMIVNGRGTSLWHDLWLGEKPLCQNEEACKLLSLPSDVKVFTLINNEQWNRVVLNIPQSQLRNNILGTPINCYLENNFMVWNLTLKVYSLPSLHMGF